jgi:hypothetical protein
LPFPCSYVYYQQFYANDAGSALAQRKSGEVKFPAQKAMRACFASVPGTFFDISPTRKGLGGHGPKGMLLLFADGHSQFARWEQLVPTSGGAEPVYNFDWTLNGLRGFDLR